MAFASGHTAPTGFTAGQLKDGASFGTIDAPAYAGGSKFKLDLRYYKNTLIVIGSRLNTAGTVIEQPTIVPSDWITSVKQLVLPANIPALSTLASLAPNASKITALGLQVGGIVPVNPTGDLIPFEQDADGNIKAYVSAAEKEKQAAEVAKQQTNLLTTLTNQVTGTNTTTKTPTTTTTTATGMSMTVKVIIGVVVAVVVGGVILMATRKKKKK